MQDVSLRIQLLSLSVCGSPDSEADIMQLSGALHHHVLAITISAGHAIKVIELRIFFPVVLTVTL